MRNLKKLLAVVVAVAFIITAMAPAFAANSVSAGIEDAKVKAAVDMLTAFKVVSGKDDGKYHPEANLTRDEFAKMVVTAMGLASAADAAKGATKFSDVATDKWSTGYINVAVGQGIVKGRADGTFGPNDNVTYAEAATILVRALGYKDEFLPGAWPGNYFAKAADAKVTKDIKVSTTGFVDRGAAAVMVRNTLDAKMVKPTEYDSSNNATKFTETTTTLLKEKLDYDKVENVRFYDNYRLNSGYDKKDIGLKLLKTGKDVIIDGKTYDSSSDLYDVIKVKADSDADVESLLGYQVKVYLDGNKVKFIEADESNTVLTDYVNEFDSDNPTTKAHLKAKDVKLVATGKNEGVNIFVNGQNELSKDDTDTGDLNLTSAIAPGYFGRFVYNGSKIVWADLFNPEYDAFVVTKVDKDNKIITGINGKDKDEEINLKDDYDEISIFAKDRAPMNVEDIKAGDVIYVIKQSIDNNDYAIITDINNNTITGKLSKYGSDYASVGTKKYDLTNNSSSGVQTAFTPNNYSDVYWYTAENVDNGKLEDVSGNDVKAYLDIAGTIRFIESNVKATSGDKYGIVTDTYTDGDRIKVWTTDDNGSGDQYTYNVEESADVKTSISKGDLIRFKLNKNGEIAKHEIYKLGKAKDTSNTNTNNNTDFFGTVGNSNKTGKTTITAGTSVTSAGSYNYVVNANAGTTYKVSDDVFIINAKGGFTSTFNKDDFEILKWADIKDTGVGSDPVAIFANDKNEAKAIIFLGNGTPAGSDPEAAYAVAKFKDGDKQMATVTIYDGDKEKDYEVNDSTSYGNLKKETPYVVKVLGSGKLKIYQPNESAVSSDFVTVTGTVYDKDGDSFRIGFADGTWYNNDGGTYKTASQTNGSYVRLVTKSVIYDGGDVKTRSNISNGKKLTIVLYKGTDARAVKIGAATYPTGDASVIK